MDVSGPGNSHHATARGETQSASRALAAHALVKVILEFGVAPFIFLEQGCQYFPSSDCFALRGAAHDRSFFRYFAALFHALIAAMQQRFIFAASYGKCGFAIHDASRHLSEMKSSGRDTRCVMRP